MKINHLAILNNLLRVIVFLMVFGLGFGLGANYVLDYINEHAVCDLIEYSNYCRIDLQ